MGQIKQFGRRNAEVGKKGLREFDNEKKVRNTRRSAFGIR